jgi:hypothetical protein
VPLKSPLLNSTSLNITIDFAQDNPAPIVCRSVRSVFLGRAKVTSVENLEEARAMHASKDRLM